MKAGANHPARMDIYRDLQALPRPDWTEKLCLPQHRHVDASAQKAQYIENGLNMEKSR